MNDSTSSGPPVESSSARRALESTTSAHEEVPGDRSPAASEDQPTIISSRPPMAVPGQDELAAPEQPGKIGAGSVLGHFELVEPIGGGGMGRVFLAKDTRLGRPVALKILSRQQAADRETLLRFRNEARSAARLNHENIAQVYYVGEDKGLPFIAFEHIEGDNIRDLVSQRGPLPLGEAISYTLQVAAALRHAAESNVVHRDVKPSNVLVTPDGHAKLIDMGLARLRSPDGSGSDLTASGVTLGTFDYISPEQARDPRVADVRSDIYSLGCTLFYMLAGRPPFPQGTVLQKLLQHQGDDPPDVRVFRPELPDEVARVLRKMMAKDPRRRFRDPSKLIIALSFLAEQIGLRPVGLSAAMWTVPKQRGVSFLQRHLPWAAPVAVLLGVVLFLDVLWSPPGETEEVLSRELVGTPEEVVTQLPAPEEPESAEPDVRRPEVPGARPEEAPPGRPEQAAVEPGGAPSEASTGQDDRPTRSPPEGVGAPEPRAGGVPPAMEESTAEVTIDEDAEGGTGLEPGGLDGGISAVAVLSAGLSAGRQGSEPWGALRGDDRLDGRPRTTGPGGDPAVKPRRPLRVDPKGGSGADFTTLGAALHAAADGDLIELRYNGRMQAEPLALAGLDVTLRAGEGFRPVVVFEPTEVDPIKYPRSMFTLTGTRLTLSDLALELKVPRDVPADSWTLFEMGRADQVRVEKCSLTIQNAPADAPEHPVALHPDVAFFRLKRAPGSEDVLKSELSVRRRASIHFDDCIVRGEAVVLRSEDLQPVDLTWENGLLVTTEWLLVADGGERAPLPAESVRIQLQSLTAIVGSGLCQLGRSAHAPHQLLAQIDCGRSILATSSASPGSLIEQLGVASVQRALLQVDWSGKGNYYGALEVFWRIQPLDPDVPPMAMTFDEWQSHWTPERESGTRLDATAWKDFPRPTRPVHTHGPADYAMLEAAGSDAHGAGGLGSAGLKAERLPALPQELALEDAPEGKSPN